MFMKKSKLKVGDKVTYLFTNIAKCEFENGIVKSIPINGAFVFVVFNCNDDWDNYQNYTAQCVSIQHLKYGWSYKNSESAEITNSSY
jgi:hypothetical protein